MHLRLTLAALLVSAPYCLSSPPPMAPNTGQPSVAASSTPQDLSKEGARLPNAPDDIQHLIASELTDISPNTLREFTHSSEASRVVALPVVYRHLLLERGNNNTRKRQAYNALIASFRSSHEEGNIAKHIRNITVKDELPVKDLLMILESISEHGTLRNLNWNTVAHMPTGVYDKLHSTWPELEISVTVLDRQYAKTAAYRRMDLRLLSSPRLIRLTYFVYNQGYDAAHPARSEWPKLTKALVDGGSLRALRLQTKSDGREIDGYVSEYDGPQVVPDSEPEKLARLDISADTRLPQLEELSIDVPRPWGSSSYLWDSEHCLLLRDAMDWSRLRKLDFGMDNPHDFFTTFTGVLPNLKALRFEVRDGHAAAAKKFIGSINALESLYVGKAQAGLDELWPAILQHKKSLKELIFGPALGREFSTQYSDLSRLKEVVDNFPGLDRLGWDIPFKTNVDAEHLEILSTMNLKKLDIFLRISDSASDYSDTLEFNFLNPVAPPPLDKERSKKAAIEIAEKISEKQKSPLQWLTLHISRTGYMDRAEPWLMQAKLQLRRKEDAHANAVAEEKYEVRGSMEWYSLLSLEEELSLE